MRMVGAIPPFRACGRQSLGLLAVILSTVLVSADVMAARPTYSYLGLNYARHEFSSGNSCVQDGVELNGSLVMNEHTFIALRHVDVTSNEWCGSTTTRLSGGFRGDVGARSSLYSIASVMARDTGNDTDPGVGLELGLRTVWESGVESKIFMGYDLVDDDDESFIGIGINYGLSRRLSLVADLAATNENATQMIAGIRFNF